MANTETLQALARENWGLDLQGALRQASGLSLDPNGIARALYGTDFDAAFDQIVTLLEGEIALGAPLVGAHSVESSGNASVVLSAPTAAGDANLAQALAVGDTLIAAIVTDEGTWSPPDGTWTELVARTALGTRFMQAYGRLRLAGDPSTYTFTLSQASNHRAVLAVVRGARDVDEWPLGTVGTRAGGSGTSTTTVAPSVTTVTDNNRVISLSGEATTGGGGTDELTSVTGATEWFFEAQGGAGAIETIAAASVSQATAGATAAVTFTYTQTQASNGAAVQVAAPGIVIPAAGYTVAELLTDDPFLIAHRCHGGWWPENTLYAAQQAAYFDKAIDIDVWQSSDGVWVCHHDQATLRMTGADHDIPTTAWSTLGALENQADECIDTAQPLRPMTRLDAILDEFLDSHVVVIEKKGTSANMAAFLDFIDAYDASDRIIIQGFAGGQTQLTLAHERGYTTWANAEDDEVTEFPGRFGSNVDLVGLNHDADPADWAATVALGKPVIGHIITSKAQGDTALGLGASGLTVSRW